MYCIQSIQEEMVHSVRAVLAKLLKLHIMADLCSSGRPFSPVHGCHPGPDQLAVHHLHGGGHSSQLWDHMDAGHLRTPNHTNPLGILIASIFSPMIVGTTNNIALMLFIYAVPAAIICLLATVGIRDSAPPTPPSASAESSNSEPFLEGIKLLLRNKAYMILLLCFGSGIAVFTCFSTLLEQIMCVRGYTNDFAGLCGGLFIVFGIVGAGFLGLYVDKTKKFTEVTKVNMSLSALACIAFSVVSQMRNQGIAVAVACSLFGFFGFSIYPVAMELSVECSYPVGEATSAGLIFISGQIQSVIYILLLQGLTKPMAYSPFSTCSVGGDAALSWRVPVLVMAGLFSVFTCCFVIFFHTKYRRLDAEAQAGGKMPTLTTCDSTSNSDPK
ncbi:solute carrier family 49 member A3 isoform 2-T2 [Salvelinus alpinus]|uniref:solute carrier family 49 member A3-like isoform X2 n=1 Tax=Salvelinus alpinus TaxID=8036 RepID=UPI0039FB9323